jgi:hypothetical protein
MTTSFELPSFEDEIKFDGRLPGVDIRDVEKLSIDIPKEQLRWVKQTLDLAFLLYRRVKEVPPLASEEMHESLCTVYQTAKKLADLLKDSGVRDQLFNALAEEPTTYGSYPCLIPGTPTRPPAVAFGAAEDTDSVARSILYRHRQGVSHLVQLADRACQKWKEKHVATTKGWEKRSASKPENSIIVAAIYTIWAGHIGKSPQSPNRNSLSPEFINFAEHVFKLNAEDFIKRSALLKRLKAPSYKKFLPNEITRKIDELNSR